MLRPSGTIDAIKAAVRPTVTWGLVAPGWAGPDEAAQRSYRAKKLWGQLSSS